MDRNVIRVVFQVEKRFLPNVKHSLAFEIWAEYLLRTELSIWDESKWDTATN